MLKLKLHYFGHLMGRADLLEKTLLLGKIERRRRRERKRRRWLDSTTDSMGTSLSKLQEIVKDRETWHAAVHSVAKSWTGLKGHHACMQNWNKDKCKEIRVLGSSCSIINVVTSTKTCPLESNLFRETNRLGFKNSSVLLIIRDMLMAL